MAGFETKTVDGVQYGIVIIEADGTGHINLEQLKAEIAKYNTRIAGVMVTNPNTSGLFEKSFKEMADLIHGAGGLVYMDGANMNAIAGWIDLNKMGVDAVHNNLHKTWTIPHGGGGPGDGMVAVSEKLIPYLPGYQIEKRGDQFIPVKAPKSIGFFHRHYGNFAHKVRAYTYIKALGSEGTRKMSAFAVLCAVYLFNELKTIYPSVPECCDDVTRMHEFILTISKDLNIKPSEIKSTKRSKNIVEARRIGIYLARTLTPNSMPSLASYFGMKDHTAVSHNIKKINELIMTNESFKLRVEELKNKILTKQL